MPTQPSNRTHAVYAGTSSRSFREKEGEKEWEGRPGKDRRADFFSLRSVISSLGGYFDYIPVHCDHY